MFFKMCIRDSGVIYLKDTVKPGMVERFARLRAIGIKTIMCTCLLYTSQRRDEDRDGTR